MKFRGCVNAGFKKICPTFERTEKPRRSDIIIENRFHHTAFILYHRSGLIDIKTAATGLSCIKKVCQFIRLS